MSPGKQARSVLTRQNLLNAARHIVENQGLDALRVEDVVHTAGVAKGTFFSHFANKDLLIISLLADEFSAIISDTDGQKTPVSVDAFCVSLKPILDFMSRRIVFDLVLKYAGVTDSACEAEADLVFSQTMNLSTRWLTQMQSDRIIRSQADPVILAEGVLAFITHSVSLLLCGSIANAESRDNRFRKYMNQWLAPC